MDDNFDLIVSQAVSRARLLERAVHDPGPWWAVVYGRETECRVPVQRTVIGPERRVVLTAYLDSCEDIRFCEIYCDGTLVTAREVPGMPSAPCRISLGIGAGHPEPAW